MPESDTPAEEEQHDPRLRTETTYYCWGEGENPGCGEKFLFKKEAEEHVETCEKAGGLGS